MSSKETKAQISPLRLMRMLAIFAADAFVICFSYFFALFVRYDCIYRDIPDKYIQGWLVSMPFWILATAAVFYCFHLYQSVWTYVGATEIKSLMISYCVLIPFYVGFAVVINYFLHLDRMPYSYYLIGYIVSFMGSCAVRFSYRFLRSQAKHISSLKGPKESVMIIGGGSAAQMILREMKVSDQYKDVRVSCIIDDNPEKKGRFLQGVEIVGGRYDIVSAAARYNVTRIIFAIPSCPVEDRKEILNICKEVGCRIQTVPGLSQLQNQNEEISVRTLRDVDVTDLLGREQISVNNAAATAALGGKVVLVTGGGGSIGSELCRQIAKAGPKELIIFDVYENNAYDIQQELRRTMPDLNLTVLIGSVRNTSRIREVMRTYRPHYVFHAAAHKHVPLMEDSPNEAIKNNVLGTYKTAKAAAEFGVEKFVLISTDKAVNPTNIMGASKRLCEMVVQMMERCSPDTGFAAVRFGNVLGSNGSVIPLFKKQIAAGGPVTITDKRIIRYFMTISEAVSLVLQASFYAKGGEIFVLDMGEPVKIDDMARNLIRLSGLRPDVDIKIEYTGLRPGEKLYEELLMNEEGLSETENKLIFIGQPIKMDDEEFRKNLAELEEAAKKEDGDIKELVARIVPTYRPEK